MKKISLIFLKMIFLVLLGAAPLSAGRSGSLHGGKAAPPSCSIVGSRFNFGMYRGKPLTAFNGMINVNCARGVVYQIGIDKGANYDTRGRRLTDGGGHYLSYILCADIGCAKQWGDLFGTVISGRITTMTMAYPATTTPWGVVAGTGTGSLQELVVFGKIFGNQNAPVGNYSDTLQVSIVY